MAQPTTPGIEATTARWQRVLAGLSLAAVTGFVAVPVGLLLLTLWTLVLAVAAAHTLDKAGVLSRSAYGLSLLVGAVTTSVAALLSLVASARKLGKARQTIDAPSVRGVRFWLAHPWTTFGVGIFAADVVLVPIDQARLVSVHPVLLGVLLVSTGLWLVGLLFYALIRGWALVLRVVWTGVRRSSFFAGIVVLGGLLITLSALLIWSGISGRAMNAGAPSSSGRLAECGFSTVECSRSALSDIANPPPPQIASPPPVTPPEPIAPFGPVFPVPEEASSFHRCIEELHRSEANAKSAREIGLLMARGVVNPADAEDIVHGAMISVCLGAERIHDLRLYFLRSVSNAAKRQKKVSSRTWCPLDPSEPPPPGLVSQCLANSVTAGTAQEDLEVAAYQALCELDADDRKLLEMRFWENLSNGDVALRLGLTVETARKRYSRALDALRKKFERRCQ